MGKNSNIEWTDHTFNPWIGCTKVSEGCKNCYAETLMDKRYSRVKWGPQGARVKTSGSNWKKPLTWNRKAKATGVRKRVFCASLADVFEEKPDQPEMDEWRKELLQLILDTKHLDWLLLTKRPENVNKTLARLAGFDEHGVFTRLQNVWVGTSVENQAQADKRIPELLKIPARVRFLSMEPLLGAVDLGFGGTMPGQWQWLDGGTLHWVIVGGESGRNARPMHPEWVRSIRDQCQESGVPFFFKQWGEYSPDSPDAGKVAFDTFVQFDNQKVIDRIKSKGFGRAIRDQGMFKIGKKRAGRKLDGRFWDEIPKR